jgi:hypothetical protein
MGRYAQSGAVTDILISYDPRSYQLGQRALPTRVVLELNHAAASGLMTGCGCGLSENNNNNLHSHGAEPLLGWPRAPRISEQPPTTTRAQCRFHVQTMTLAVSA